MSSKSTCPALPSKCNKENGPSGSTKCTRDICQDNGICIPETSNSVYTECVTGFVNNGKVPDDCMCNNRRTEEATIDIYILNNTSETIVLNGDPDDALNWVLLGKHRNRCDGGFWQLPPAKSIPSKTGILARAYSKRHTDSDDCCRDTDFNLCFTYGVVGSPDEFVKFELTRKRPGNHNPSNPTERCSELCTDFKPVKANTETSPGLSLQGKVLDHSTVQFIITAGKAPSGCSVSPVDNCPAGQYCPGEGQSCLPGCKIDPIPNGSCSGTDICDPTSRTCVSPRGCTNNLKCPLNFICDVTGGTGVCVAGCVESENRCSTGKTCVQGQCQNSNNGGGGNTQLRNILIIVAVVVFVIIIVGGIIYVSKS